MEEIKGMTSVNDLSTLYNVTSDYSYTENADDGSYDIESLPAKEFPFYVSMRVEPLSDNSNADIHYEETITITDNTCSGTKFPEFVL